MSKISTAYACHNTQISKPSPPGHISADLCGQICTFCTFCNNSHACDLEKQQLRGSLRYNICQNAANRSSYLKIQPAYCAVYAAENRLLNVIFLFSILQYFGKNASHSINYGKLQTGDPKHLLGSPAISYFKFYHM